MNKKVLVTFTGGVPTIYADYGVDVVVLDYDDAKCTHPDELIPIHLDYLPLIQFADALGDWPLDINGRVNDALNLADQTWTFPENTRWIVLSPCVPSLLNAKLFTGLGHFM